MVVTTGVRAGFEPWARQGGATSSAAAITLAWGTSAPKAWVTWGTPTAAAAMGAASSAASWTTTSGGQDRTSGSRSAEETARLRHERGGQVRAGGAAPGQGTGA